MTHKELGERIGFCLGVAFKLSRDIIIIVACLRYLGGM